MVEDPELQAMATIKGALDSLETPEARERVLRWAAERSGLGPPLRAGGASSQRSGGDSGGGEVTDIPGLFNAADPSTDPQRALVVGYWFQQVQMQPDFSSQQVNAELKNLGHGVGNITDAFTSLMDRRPRLVIQTHKSGKAKQARKKYKLTTEGIRAVQTMMQGGPPEEE